MSALLSSDPADWILLEQVDSTNRFMLSDNHKSGSSCLANYQSAGRGRQERSWQQQAGNGFLYSGLIEMSQSIAMRKPGMIPLLSGLAVIEALHAYLNRIKEAPSDNSRLKESTEFKLSIKWPNDIILKRSDATGKLAGILIESRTIGKQVLIVIGIGLNWRGQVPEVAPARLAPISLFEQSQTEPAVFLPWIIRSLNHNLKLYYQSEDSNILNAIRNQFFLDGSFFTYQGKQLPVAGMADDGSLLLHQVDGRIIAIHEAE